MSYAIQARPALAWREVAIQAGFLLWALVMLVVQNG
jgi:hypothetical protein